MVAASKYFSSLITIFSESLAAFKGLDHFMDLLSLEGAALNIEVPVAGKNFPSPLVEVEAYDDYIPVLPW